MNTKLLLLCLPAFLLFLLHTASYLPSLPAHRPSLPAPLPSLPAHLPSLPAPLPSLPAHLPSLPANLPSLPAHLPSLPANLPSLPGHLPSLPAQPAPDPRALANYQPTNWSRVRALPWSLHLAPVNTSSCSWPVLDPWHPDILKYVTDRPGDRVNCTNQQKTLLYTSMDRLVLNTTALRELNLNREDVRCTFVYTNSTDGKVGDGPVVELEGEEMNLNPRNLSLLATCNHTKTDRLI